MSNLVKTKFALDWVSRAVPHDFDISIRFLPSVLITSLIYGISGAEADDTDGIDVNL